MDSAPGCSGCRVAPGFGEVLDSSLALAEPPCAAASSLFPWVQARVCRPKLHILLAVQKVLGAPVIFHPACLTGLTRVLSHRNYLT